MGSVIKMYGPTTGGSQDSIAMIDVPMPGRILGIDWAVEAQLATDFFFYGQLSFRPAATFSTNDDRGVLSEVRFRLEITTTGGTELMVNKYVQLPEVPVMGGERLYLHASSTAAVVGTMVALVHFDFDFDKIATRRR